MARGSPADGCIDFLPVAVRVTQATPLNVIIADSPLIHEMPSLRSSTPNTALSTGTESCTAPALIAVVRTRTQYQIAYPIVEARVYEVYGARTAWVEIDHGSPRFHKAGVLPSGYVC